MGATNLSGKSTLHIGLCENLPVMIGQNENVTASASLSCNWHWSCITHTPMPTQVTSKRAGSVTRASDNSDTLKIVEKCNIYRKTNKKNLGTETEF